MRSLQRRVGILFLLALLIIAHTLFAQDNTQITVVGSGVVIPALDALATASGVTTVSLSTTVTGTTPGFDLFCHGQADVTTANRPITPDENSACTNTGVEYAELLIGNSVVAVIASPDVTFASCLTTADLDRIFAPSAAGQTSNWNQLNTEYPDLALSVYVPQETTSAFAGIDRMVDGDGLRSDAAYLDTAAILSAVENGTGSIGVVNLPEALAAGASVNTLLVNTNDAVGCQSPSAQNVEGRLYQGGERLFIYVNRTALGKPGVLDLLTFASVPAGADALNGLGLTPPTEETYALNAAALEGTATGSQFVTDTASFTISPDVTGSINIGGSPIARDYLDTATNAFTSSYSGVTITSTLDGEPSGFRRLCNGEVDIAATSNGLSEEAQTNCTANNITPFTIDLGRQAVVLVANANTPFLACLTTQQLTTAWGVSAIAAEPITNWNQVDSTFPDQAITLFQPPSGNDSTDLLMIQSAGQNVPARNDTQFHRDPLYRAAATANVDGALTFMSWKEYQRVLANNQANIQLVAVDSGNGCISPDEHTIASGTYPLTRGAQLIVNTAALARPEIQSLLWFMAEDANYAMLDGSNLIGIPFGDLPALRERLLQAYKQAEAAALISPEATPEPEATVEATAEATVEMTPEATIEATAEPTVEATVEVTPEATIEATVEATVEVTPEATAASGG